MEQNIQDTIEAAARRGNEVEKKLSLHLGGYSQRARALRQKILDKADALEKARIEFDTSRTAQIAEEGAVIRRLEGLREEVRELSGKERMAQEVYRRRKDELDSLAGVNGIH